MVSKRTITRPANTTAYSIGDVLSGDGIVIPITIDADLGNSVILNSSIISSNPASTPSLTLNFYSESFTVAADNAAYVPTPANQKNFLGKIKHTNWAATTNEKTSTNDISKPICVVPTLSSAHIFCVVTLESTYTPTSAEQITIVLNIVQ